jgi:hypothetical protein
MAACPVRVAEISVDAQQQSNWCWAALIQSLLRCRGDTATQEEIVTTHLNRTGRRYTCGGGNEGHQTGGECTDVACSASCNDEHSLGVTLPEIGLLSGDLSVGRPPPFELLVEEIANQRPVPCRVAWTSGGGHVFLIVACSVQDGTPTVHALDPAAAPAGAVPEDTVAHADLDGAYVRMSKIGRVDHAYGIT